MRSLLAGYPKRSWCLLIDKKISLVYNKKDFLKVQICAFFIRIQSITDKRMVCKIKKAATFT